MKFIFPGSTRHSVLAISGLSLAAIMPLLNPAPASAQTTFSDVSFSYWARPFIEKLAANNIIKGFPDGSFKPDEPVTRSQFAAIVRQAFDQAPVRQYNGFNDVPSSYWAAPAIQKAYTTGFMSGYPGGKFEPGQRIPRVQALVSLASGLELKVPADKANTALEVYRDAADIPEYAIKGVSAATQSGVVVNYPNVKYLNPNQVATRADIAAFVYQSLVNQRQLPPIGQEAKATNYIVTTAAGTQTQARTQPNQPRSQQPAGQLIARGTQIQLKYPGDRAVKLVVAPGETYETSLAVAKAILNSKGDVLVPIGSRVTGRFVPLKVNDTTPATQFVADQLIIGNQSYALNATSNPKIAVNKTDLKPVDLRSAVTTAAARTVVESVFGQTVNLGNILGNAVGVQQPTTTQNTVIVIDPNSLSLTTQSDFRVAGQ